MRRDLTIFIYATALAWLVAGFWVVQHAHAQDVCTIGHEHDEDAEEDPATREEAAQPVAWRAALSSVTNGIPSTSVPVQILSINDFHGQLAAGRRVANRPVGGAAVLKAYLDAAQAGKEDHTFIVHAGDHVGASPPDSALLQDEPSISFLNMFANRYCNIGRTYPLCNVIGTLGNHEFDEGKKEMLRLVRGGKHPNGPFLEKNYKGAKFAYVSSNVVEEKTGTPLLRPYVIKKVDGVPIAFIGAVLKQTPTIVTPTGVAGLSFLDEADAINSYVPELKEKGVHAIVVLIHQGAFQTNYPGATDPTRPGPDVSTDIVKIVQRLDDEIDVVVSGHAHQFTNTLLTNNNGKQILVTQSFSAGTAYGDIDLEIDRATRDVVAKTASIITTFGDAGPGLTPDVKAAELAAKAAEKVAPLVNQVVGSTAAVINRDQTTAGESALGNFIADAQRAAMGTDFAFMNPGGIRADLDMGDVTWGELFTVQPFGNSLVKLEMTGQQIYAVLNQQLFGPVTTRFLQISGLTYTWDFNRPAGDRIVEVRKNGALLDLAATYTVTANNFIAAGGDGFTVFTQGQNPVGGPIDLDALIDYIKTLSQPFSASIEGRISRLN